MSVVIIDGVPGAGKTYYAVHHLLSKHFYYDKVFCEYLPRHRVSIVSNIDDLRLDHVSLKEALRTTTLTEFFTIEYQTEFLKSHAGLVFIIDEAQQYFNDRFSDNGVLTFFEYHRHLGFDVYLICPNSEALARRLRGLAEYTIRAGNRAVRVFSEFKYTKFVNGEKVGRVVLKPSMNVFRLYRSMLKPEETKVKSFARKYFVFAGIGVLAIPVVLFSVIKYFFGTHTPSKKAPVVLSSDKVVTAGVPSSASVVSAPSAPAGSSSVPSSVVSPLRDLSGNSIDIDTFKKSYRRIYSVAGSKTVFTDATAKIYSESELSLLAPKMVFYLNSLYVPLSQGEQDAERTARRAEARSSVGSLYPRSGNPVLSRSEIKEKQEGGKSYILKNDSVTRRAR